MTPEKSSESWLFDALLASYLLMFVPIFLSNHDRLANRLFLYLVVPLSVLPFLELRTAPIDRRGHDIRLTVRAHLPRRVSFVFLAICVYLIALNIASWTNGGIANDVLVTQAFRTIPIMMFMLVTTLLVVTHPAFVERLFVTVCLLAACSAIVNIVDFVRSLQSWHDLYTGRLVTAVGMTSYRNSTNISVTYAVYLAGAVGCLVGARKLWPIAVLTGASTVLLAGLLMTQARGALIGAIAGLAAIALTRSRRLQPIAIAAALPVGLVLAALPWVQDRIFRGVSERPQIWKAYLAKASERPLLGYGERQDISIVIPNGSVVDQAHNLVLSGQVRGGLFAGAALVFILAAGIYWTWRYFKRTGQVAPLAAFVTMATCGIFDYNLLITPADWPWVTFWLPMALAVGAEYSLRNGYDEMIAAPVPT